MIVDGVLAILLLLTLFDGYKQGALKILARLAAVVISWVAAGMIARQSQGWVAQTWIMPLLKEQAEEVAELGALVEDAMETGAESIAYGMVYLVIFLFLQIIFQIFLRTLNVVNRIPVVGTINRMGGLILGFAWYMIVLLTVAFILFRVVPRDTRKSMGLSDGIIRESMFLSNLAEAVEDG